MAEMLIQSESLTSIADKIRALKGITEPMSLYDMETELDIIPKNDSSDLTASGATVTVPAGYYASQATKSVTTATQATPSISINSSGLITASATQTAGYVAAGTKSGTKQLTTQAAKTITPSSSVQTAVNSGVYTTGEIKVAAIPSSYTQLNFTVVGGTSQPSNPAENTIWVNTQTTISGWSFIAEKPTWSMAAGYVCFVAETSTNNTKADFNALKSNEIWIDPVNAWQYVNNSWVQKVVKIYKNNAWVDLIEVIDFNTTTWTKKNPYPSRTYAQGSYDLSNSTLKGYVTSSYQHVVMVKNEKINFSSCNQLKFVYSLSRNLSSYGAIIVKISSSNSDPNDTSCVINQQIIEAATNTEVNIDVSSLNSSYYLWIGLVVWGSAGTVNFEVSNLHLM